MYSSKSFDWACESLIVCINIIVGAKQFMSTSRVFDSSSIAIWLFKCFIDQPGANRYKFKCQNQYLYMHLICYPLAVTKVFELRIFHKKQTEQKQNWNGRLKSIDNNHTRASPPRFKVATQEFAPAVNYD